ncbi:MAG: T9SS type A sorting domain-containing protein [Fidelibacterota bacterium]|nr:MAG: T9SS type A sorting domain-containing protein [Candidatus Neomarinimicrobiota bacterium]
MKHVVIFVFTVWAIMQAQTPDLEPEPCSRGKAFLKYGYPQRTMNPSVEQQKIDITYYRCQFDISPDSRSFEASVLARAVVIDSSISNFELNFTNHNYENYQVANVWLDGDTATYTHASHRLTVPVSGDVDLYDTLEVLVTYTASHPSATTRLPLNFDSYDSKDLIWTMSQPYDARFWWPCKDFPGDKADSVDIYVTVPDPLIVASNGRLVSSTAAGEGRTTYHWHEGYPISTYLVSLAIYPFYVWGNEYVSPASDTLPIQFYTFRHPDNSEQSYLESNYLKTRSMMEVFTGLFGEYPFLDEKYGHAEWGASYGMEHQTITSMGNPTERRVAHELAHQWWGDMITCNSYHHMWLNEGFGTYAEALWVEAVDGKTAYNAYMQDLAYYGSGSHRSGTIYVEDPLTEDVFDYYLNYRKGAWVLHMLRNVVGDSSFFQILRAYGDDPELKYGTATTEQFRDICEDVSGQELDAFFQQWIYGSYYPIYSVSWNHTADSLRLTIQQVQQSTSTVYQMPIDVRVIAHDTSFTWVVNNSADREEFKIPLSSTHSMRSIVLDPDNWILKGVTYLASTEETILPPGFELRQPFPNPFNATATILFDLPHYAAARLTILDVQGRLVWEHQAEYGPGAQQVIWPGTGRTGQPVASGTYLVRLVSGVGTQTRKLILLK